MGGWSASGKSSLNKVSSCSTSPAPVLSFLACVSKRIQCKNVIMHATFFYPLEWSTRTKKFLRPQILLTLVVGMLTEGLGVERAQGEGTDIRGVLGLLGAMLVSCLLPTPDLVSMSLVGCDLAFLAGRGGESGDTNPSYRSMTVRMQILCKVKPEFIELPFHLSWCNILLYGQISGSSRGVLRLG